MRDSRWKVRLRRLRYVELPAAAQYVQVSIDALVIPEVLPFWLAVLGYREVGNEDLLDLHSRGPSFWFQQMDAQRARSQIAYTSTSPCRTTRPRRASRRRSPPAAT